MLMKTGVFTSLCEGQKEGECGWNLVHYSPSTLLSPVSTHEFVSQDFFLLTIPVCKDVENASPFICLSEHQYNCLTALSLLVSLSDLL